MKKTYLLSTDTREAARTLEHTHSCTHTHKMQQVRPSRQTMVATVSVDHDERGEPAPPPIAVAERHVDEEEMEMVSTRCPEPLSAPGTPVRRHRQRKRLAAPSPAAHYRRREEDDEEEEDSMEDEADQRLQHPQSVFVSSQAASSDESSPLRNTAYDGQRDRMAFYRCGGSVVSSLRAKLNMGTWTICALLVLIVVCVVLMVLAFTTPAPEHQVVSAREEGVASSWTLVHRPTGVRYTISTDGTDSAWLTHTWNAQGLLLSSVLVTHGAVTWREPVSGNCYTARHGEDVTVRLPRDSESISLLAREWHVQTQPFPVNVPSLQNAPSSSGQSPCVEVAWRFGDHARVPPPVVPKATSINPDVSHFQVDVAQDVRIVDKQLRQIDPELDMDVTGFVDEMLHLVYNVTVSMLRHTEEPQHWLLWPPKITAAQHASLFSTCTSIKHDKLTRDYRGLFKLCSEFLFCTQNTAPAPPAATFGLPPETGYGAAWKDLTSNETCTHAKTETTCECLNRFASSLIMPAYNQCGLCRVNHAIGPGSNLTSQPCLCWARARFLALVAQYTPCTHADKVPLDPAEGSDLFPCGVQRTCNERVGKQACNSVTSWCKLGNAVRASRFQCFSTLYDYLKLYNREAPIVA